MYLKCEFGLMIMILQCPQEYLSQVFGSSDFPACTGARDVALSLYVVGDQLTPTIKQTHSKDLIDQEKQQESLPSTWASRGQKNRFL